MFYSPKMKLKLIFLVGPLFFRFAFCWNTVDSDQITADDNLMSAHLICRHGERNLLETYPNDQWQSIEYWPGGFGELTNLGKLQLFDAGQYFQKRYANLIGTDGYSSDEAYVRSTDMDRVLMSAQAFLAGLFPPSPNQMWNKDLAWQPIPVHTMPFIKDNVLSAVEDCDRFNYLMIQFEETAAYKDLFEKNQTLIRYIEENSGQKLPTILDILVLHDTFQLEQDRGYYLPTWAEIAMEPGNDFEYLALKWYEIQTATPEMKKLRRGYLLKEILDHFRDKVQSELSPDRSLWMYFAHDFTLGEMLNSLGLYWPHKPPPASCLLLELHQSNTEPYVKISYKNSTDVDIPVLEIPNCGTECPLERMYELYDDWLPTRSFGDECKLKNGEVLPPDGNPESGKKVLSSILSK